METPAPARQGHLDFSVSVDNNIQLGLQRNMIRGRGMDSYGSVGEVAGFVHTIMSYGMREFSLYLFFPSSVLWSNLVLMISHNTNTPEHTEKRNWHFH